MVGANGAFPRKVRASPIEYIYVLEPEHLGKVTLYQTELRSLPFKRGRIKPKRSNCKPRFPVGRLEIA